MNRYRLFLLSFALITAPQAHAMLNTARASSPMSSFTAALELLRNKHHEMDTYKIPAILHGVGHLIYGKDGGRGEQGMVLSQFTKHLQYLADFLYEVALKQKDNRELREKAFLNVLWFFLSSTFDREESRYIRPSYAPALFKTRVAWLLKNFFWAPASYCPACTCANSLVKTIRNLINSNKNWLTAESSCTEKREKLYKELSSKITKAIQADNDRLTPQEMAEKVIKLMWNELKTMLQQSCHADAMYLTVCEVLNIFTVADHNFMQKFESAEFKESPAMPERQQARPNEQAESKEAINLGPKTASSSDKH